MCLKSNCIFLYCNQISLRWKYGREQMKFAHVKVIYTLCVSKIIFFLQFAKHKLRNDTVCYTPLLAAR